LFFWFSLSLVFWAAQGLYARAFYAAGNTLTPMMAGTAITIASLPVYALLFHRWDVVGLSIASDIGIAAHTVTLAWLLHRNRLVPAQALPWKFMLKLLGIAVFAGTAGYGASRVVIPEGSRASDFASMGLVSITWSAAVILGLWLTKPFGKKD
jgi:putative peptidoglycan lipid II flippase